MPSIRPHAAPSAPSLAVLLCLGVGLALTSTACKSDSKGVGGKIRCDADPFACPPGTVCDITGFCETPPEIPCTPGSGAECNLAVEFCDCEARVCKSRASLCSQANDPKCLPGQTCDLTQGFCMGEPTACLAADDPDITDTPDDLDTGDDNVTPDDEDDQVTDEDTTDTIDPDVTEPDADDTPIDTPTERDEEEVVVQPGNCASDAACPYAAKGQRCNPNTRQCEWCDPVCDPGKSCNWDGSLWYCGSACPTPCPAGQACNLDQCVPLQCQGVCQRCFSCSESTGFVCRRDPQCTDGDQDGERRSACLPPNSPCEPTDGCCSGTCLMGYCM